MTTPTIAARWVRVGLPDAITVELTGQLPVDVVELLRQAEAQAYARGRADAMRCLADDRRLSLLDSDWREQAMAMRAAQIQHRQECAQARADDRREAANVAAGRHPGYRYRGGPVDFESGLPVKSPCAWLRRKRLRDAEQAVVTQMPERSTAPPRRDRQAA